MPRYTTDAIRNIALVGQSGCGKTSLVEALLQEAGAIATAGDVEKGNTVALIEHNLDVLKQADYIIDLGPEGGSRGGEVIATGTPEHISTVPGSFTGRYLQSVLQN